ncbi:tumor necrosis factor ligand superfamily member 8-like [Xenopus laevis]|uniref:Tumor necrosis factor ligand superfamily member 8-like n=1 Tax=Xenopus laevis TaxID=8355 RepID=A0A8J1LGE9_XENLA|nr:tumor necrosis factor ligand superfamily member 8-like [Xenopus laevis]
MEPQSNVSQEQHIMKKRLCFISITVCAVCLACTSASFALLFLCRKHSSTEMMGTASQKGVPGTKCPEPVHHYEAAATAQLKLAKNEPFSANQTVLWQENVKLKNMKYQNGSLIILTKGLYYIYCHLHFMIEECFEDYEDLQTILNVNNKPRHQAYHTIIQQSNCTIRVYRDQYLGLQVYLNAYDNVSIQTNHVKWLNRNYLPDDSLFGAFKLNGHSAE